jgi:two-component system response regulator YesN
LNDLCSGFMTTSEVMHHSTSIQLNIIAHYYVVTVLDLRETEAYKHKDMNAMYEHERLLLDKCIQLKINSEHLMFQRSRSESVWMNYKFFRICRKRFPKKHTPCPSPLE